MYCPLNKLNDDDDVTVFKRLHNERPPVSGDFVPQTLYRHPNLLDFGSSRIDVDYKYLAPLCLHFS